MTDLHHPITPSIELVKQWSDRWHSAKDNDFDVVLFVAIEAARWGSDQELEACCDVLKDWGSFLSPDLHDARRPKPPSLKDQALKLIDSNSPYLDDAAMSIIRRAVESLPD